MPCLVMMVFVVRKLLTSIKQLNQFQHFCCQQIKESSCTVVVSFFRRRPNIYGVQLGSSDNNKYE